jgi:NodT family efflux transporter outer membrane factor (OMF) lipoprotein
MPLDMPVPSVPVGLPAEVLERRPDIAAAERRLAAAHAQVGIAATAFYPVLALTGSTGFESATLGKWLNLASNFWSVAPAAAMAVFDGGRRRAVSDQARAAYTRAEALYRETVLVAFREVEDNLAALRVLEAEATTQAAAIAAAERLLALSTNRYRGGVTTYLEVVVAQGVVLNNRRTGANILARRLTASVLLVKALGGGWDVSRLPLQ